MCHNEQSIQKENVDTIVHFIIFNVFVHQLHFERIISKRHIIIVYHAIALPLRWNIVECIDTFYIWFTGFIIHQFIIAISIQWGMIMPLLYRRILDCRHTIFCFIICIIKCVICCNISILIDMGILYGCGDTPLPAYQDTYSVL